MLRFLTAGESHGPALTVIIEGFPAGMPIDFEAVNHELARRQQGYGRGQRMKIERDRVDVAGGIRNGKTTGGPICLQIKNKDWKNWKKKLSPYPDDNQDQPPELVSPRPGHADLAGALKYGVEEFRDILERASARETAARVAAGAIAKQFLKRISCNIGSHVLGIGPVGVGSERAEVVWEAIEGLSNDSPLRCADPGLEQETMEAIDRAAQAGDTLGGVIEVVAHTPPPGLGSFIQWDRKLDGLLGQAMLSIPGVKAVSIGQGLESVRLRGSELHDEIFYKSSKGLHRKSNRAGGLEGGVTNGEELRVKVYMKPLSSLRKPLRSVNIQNLEPIEAAKVRSDTCAVPAAGVVAEAMVALTLAKVALEKFGGDSLQETLSNYRAHMKRIEHLYRGSSPEKKE
jgi:chorismate synthase